MRNISSSTHESTFVFSTDRGFVPCLGVLIRSILDHANSERMYRLVVLHSQLDKKNILTLKEMTKDCKNVRLDFMDVTEELTGYSFFTENRGNTREAYFRLLIPWLLPQTEKAVYLDCDMVALTDIYELYDTDVSDVLLAASRDFIGIGIYYSGRFGLKNYFDNELCFPNPDDYFISGVLVMNLEAFRKRFSKKQILDYAASQPWHFHDQDVLNIICFGEILFLSAKWGAVGNSEYENFLTPKLRVEAMNAHQDPYIFHFAGPRNKPWHRVTEYSLAWFWPTAARTPYYGVLMEKFVEWQHPSQVKIRGEKNMLKRFLKKFLPSSARHCGTL